MATEYNRVLYEFAPGIYPLYEDVLDNVYQRHVGAGALADLDARCNASFDEGIRKANEARLKVKSAGYRAHRGWDTWKPRRGGDAADSAIYHVVQEALLNAFRHGKATEATVALWETGGAIAVAINDNGSGADGVQEGIGMRGTRERVHALGGHFRADTTAHGFAVRVEIPLGEIARG